MRLFEWKAGMKHFCKSQREVSGLDVTTSWLAGMSHQLSVRHAIAPHSHRMKSKYRFQLEILRRALIWHVAAIAKELALRMITCADNGLRIRR